MEVSGRRGVVIDFARARQHFSSAKACEAAALEEDDYTAGVLRDYAATLRLRGAGMGIEGGSASEHSHPPLQNGKLGGGAAR